MTMGEYNIDILLLQDDKMNSTDVQYPVVTFALLVVFVVLMPILFLNLLTSLAVGDTQEIQKSADTYRLILKVEFILPMEEFLRSLLRNALSIFRKIHASNVVEDFLEKLRQNLIIIGQEQKIYPNKSSVWKKFIGSLIEKRLVTEPLATVTDVKYQIKPLSEEVKGLQSSVDHLLSIVRSMRNERGGGRGSGRAVASERERDNGEEEREVSS
ncbi:PREDICTED: uncharacterized protein LOC109586206 [Amphimedon queenslandica]|uniref:Ion transport domain-containing protein n=1 Tax=Amphimedon queenslandica TaxID=400682 RepID=A0AAN0JME7_AMPQE|nr:PREDICTED: uncharacterized protein LOC109586206 [Amphimedon queenslandica]|eukprot:XP_019857940.1 PREDICTED: uncharacterized protein LOC109586206 [Amphimedon queenslandica]